MRLAKGCRLLQGDDARLRRRVLADLADAALNAGFDEVVLPSLEPAAVYADKAGPEILSQMYTLTDGKGRELCLRPEGTATLQELARSWNGRRRDVRVFYETRCWRYETPQAGRYREFTQFGVEVLNPRAPVEQVTAELLDLARAMLEPYDLTLQVDASVSRGLAYYTAEGFEISCPLLGAQRQLLGGGVYAEGAGFAVGVDRLCLAVQARGS